MEDLSRATVYMESLGINLNFAPVADLRLEAANTCLEGRCFGAAPDEAIPYVQKTVAVSHIHSLLACAKHFPGLGAAQIDPHVETAVADYGIETWQRREMLTFQAAVEADVDMVMTTHLLVPNIDDTIATGSSKIIGSLLRTNLNFQGVVVTDDLTMSGADALGDYGERAVAALEAGHDLLLFGKNFDAAQESFEAVHMAVENGRISAERVRQSLDRVASVKYRLVKTAGHFI
jgi:beta-N-acetylhexosaminidase